MATHSSVLAWRIPGTEEPGGLQSIGVAQSWTQLKRLSSSSSSSSSRLPTGLPLWLNGKESTCQAGDVGLIPGSDDPLEKEMATHSNILTWEISRTERSWQATVHGGPKSWTRFGD